MGLNYGRTVRHGSSRKNNDLNSSPGATVMSGGITASASARTIERRIARTLLAGQPGAEAGRRRWSRSCTRR